MLSLETPTNLSCYSFMDSHSSGEQNIIHVYWLLLSLFTSPFPELKLLQKVCLETPDSTFPEDTSSCGSRYEVFVKISSFHLNFSPLRGYNESGKPEGIDAYHMGALVADIKCLVKELGVEKFTLVRLNLKDSPFQRVKSQEKWEYMIFKYGILW